MSRAGRRVQIKTERRQMKRGGAAQQLKYFGTACSQRRREGTSKVAQCTHDGPVLRSLPQRFADRNFAMGETLRMCYVIARPG